MAIDNTNNPCPTSTDPNDWRCGDLDSTVRRKILNRLKELGTLIGGLDLDVTLEPGDIEIGAVEIKDSGSNNRATVGPDGCLSVEVCNFPATQPISGTVSVDNFPAVQTVNVNNFPATQPVSGTVAVSNFPATQPVSGTVAVSNFPASASVVGGGVEAPALRVTIANDSTGLLSVDDNGGSLTVDTLQLPVSLVGGRLDINVGAWFGSTAPTVGQKTMANSIPVTMASDQPAIPVSLSFSSPAATLEQTIQTTGLFNGKIAYIFKILGRRAGFTSITLPNDIKEFDNAVANFPVLAASTLDIISSSAADTNAAGTGVRTVKVVYINSANVMVESAAIALNGTTLVTSVLTGVNEVLWMETATAGSGGVAAGNIRLRINGGTVEVEQISVGFNKSRSAKFMVQTGYTAYLIDFRSHAINNDQDTSVQAEVNSLDRTLSTVYHTQSTAYVASNTNSSSLPLNFLKIPALARIKMNTISAGAAVAVRVDTVFTIALIQN